MAHYDNSEQNPRNPNRPLKPVRFGEATTDEMCIGFIAVTQKGQDLTSPGTKDELREIFERQRREFERMCKEHAKKPAAESRPKAN